ncbi:selina-4(15),7(11)-diene synthase [Streptomyces qinglanensis]|uniref:selina-4(15),7(11)-diene synthase n=1 Tax=Streptomyces qinglanensis TaxID=943816 RepID=UPI003D70865C
MQQDLPIPPLYAPTPPTIHPRHAAIDQRTADWAHAFRIGSPQLRDQLVAQSIGTFAARILPEGREEVAQLLADFVLWLFGVDDGLCEEGALGKQPGQLSGELSWLLRIAQSPETPARTDDPLALGLRDLRRRVDAYGSPAQAARWVDTLREYVLSVVWEADHRARRIVPGLDDYTLMRLYSGATTVGLPLLEMGYDYELRSSERDHRAVRAATEMASMIIAWDNDLLSHAKERASGLYYLNVVRVLEHSGLCPPEAVAEAVRQRDAVMLLFLRLREQLMPQASPQLRQYLLSLGHYIRAAQDWEVASLRYPNGPPVHLTDTPPQSDAASLEIAPIRWWWDLLPEHPGLTQQDGLIRTDAPVP